MNRVKEIKEAIRSICGRGSGWMFVGKVISTSGDTCKVDVSGVELDEVRLTAANDGMEGKLVVTPKAGSLVLLADLSGGEFRDIAVVGWSQVEKVEADMEVILNGGKNGGLVNVGKLKEWMRNVEADLQTLKVLLATSPIAGQGAPAGIVFSPQTASVAAKIEDKNIKH